MLKKLVSQSKIRRIICIISVISKNVFALFSRRIPIVNAIRHDCNRNMSTVSNLEHILQEGCGISTTWSNVPAVINQPISLQSLVGALPKLYLQSLSDEKKAIKWRQCYTRAGGPPYSENYAHSIRVISLSGPFNTCKDSKWPLLYRKCNRLTS